MVPVQLTLAHAEEILGVHYYYYYLGPSPKRRYRYTSIPPVIYHMYNQTEKAFSLWPRSME